ncbi:Os04g0194750, partial [Oryza sativa Japonica Group]
EHANADVMFWLLRSISGISSTTNIDSGSDKYSCIVVRSTLGSTLDQLNAQKNILINICDLNVIKFITTHLCSSAR